MCKPWQLCEGSKPQLSWSGPLANKTFISSWISCEHNFDWVRSSLNPWSLEVTSALEGGVRADRCWMLLSISTTNLTITASLLLFHPFSVMFSTIIICEAWRIMELHQDHCCMTTPCGSRNGGDRECIVRPRPPVETSAKRRTSAIVLHSQQAFAFEASLLLKKHWLRCLTQIARAAPFAEAYIALLLRLIWLWLQAHQTPWLLIGRMLQANILKWSIVK